MSSECRCGKVVFCRIMNFVTYMSTDRIQDLRTFMHKNFLSTLVHNPNFRKICPQIKGYPQTFPQPVDNSVVFTYAAFPILANFITLPFE